MVNSRWATYYITAADKYIKIIDGSMSKLAPKPKKETVMLPAGAKTWRTYQLNETNTPPLHCEGLFS